MATTCPSEACLLACVGRLRAEVSRDAFEAESWFEMDGGKHGHWGWYVCCHLAVHVISASFIFKPSFIAFQFDR